jgi:hypothetical protein
MYGAGVERGPLFLLALIDLLYQPWVIVDDDDDDDCKAICGMNEWQRKPKYSEKTCFSAAAVHHRSHMT